MVLSIKFAHFRYYNFLHSRVSVDSLSDKISCNLVTEIPSQRILEQRFYFGMGEKLLDKLPEI